MLDLESFTLFVFVVLELTRPALMLLLGVLLFVLLAFPFGFVVFVLMRLVLELARLAFELAGVVAGAAVGLGFALEPEPPPVGE